MKQNNKHFNLPKHSPQITNQPLSSLTEPFSKEITFKAPMNV